MTRIYIVASEGGSPSKSLPEDSDPQNFPYWSPDGHKIAFNVFRVHNDETEDIRILDLDTRKVTTIPGSDGLNAPRWSPDGRYISATGDEQHLKIFDFKTQRWSELAQKGLVDSPEWSKDGQYIYFRRVGGDLGLFRISIKGSPAEKIVDLKDWHDAGWYGAYMGLDPTDASLLLRDIGSDDIYALTLNRK
jgi:Tol biopolymer transport system component